MIKLRNGATGMTDEVDIHETYSLVMKEQIAVLADVSEMSPTGIQVTFYLGQLHHLIQTVEVTFAQYQIMRCDPAFDPEADDGFVYAQLVRLPYRALKDRIRDLASVDPKDAILPAMHAFCNYRNWAAHKMTATFVPLLYNDELAKGLSLLVAAMMAYVSEMSEIVNKAVVEWLLTFIPRTHHNFTTEKTAEFREHMAAQSGELIPDTIELPTDVTSALKQAGFWPYPKPPGNKGAVLGIGPDGIFGQLANP